MKPEETSPPAVRALEAALAAGAIPERHQAAARAIMARLTQPVRVSVFGLPGAGKSAIVNLLLGQRVLAAEARLPTLQITHGPQSCAEVTLADGSTRHLEGFDGAALAALGPIFVAARMDLPALSRISVLEVVAPADARSFARALAWAAPRTDIAIWCTQDFDATEQALWTAAPDQLKDHAYLLLTRADVLAAGGRLDPMLADLRERCVGEFSRVLAVATEEAIAARRPDGGIDRERLERSGGKALIAAILRDIELGRQAALDRALLMVQRYAPEAANAAAGAPKAGTAADPARPAPATPAPPAPPPATPDAAEEAGSATAAAGAPPEQTAGPRRLDARTRALLEQANAHLAEKGRTLSERFREARGLDADALMEELFGSVQWIGDHLAGQDGPADPRLEGLRAAVFDATDLLQLMQMEGGDRTLPESLGIAIQLRRELEACLAA